MSDALAFDEHITLPPRPLCNRHGPVERDFLSIGAGNQVVDTRRPLQATPYVWRDPHSIPARDWLSGRHLIRKFTSATIAQGGVGKSTLIIGESLAEATGRSLFGQGIEKPLRSWLWNLEDPKEELERRFQAACLRYEVSVHDLGGRFFMDSGRDQPFASSLTWIVAVARLYSRWWTRS
jgi:hypothetical protein